MRSLFQFVADRLLEELPADADGNVRIALVTAPPPPLESDWDQVHRDLGYEWCRPCAEWHRPPECAIDEDGVPELDWENCSCVEGCPRCVKITL